MQKLNIYETVKQSVSVPQAASFYGLRTNRSGMCRCPFHSDHEPSMKLYPDHYHCFACGAHGDVIGLAAGLIHLSPMEAAKKLTADFVIDNCDGYDALPALNPAASAGSKSLSAEKNLRSIRSEEESIHRRRARAYFAFCDYRQLLLRWRELIVPQSGEEPTDSYCIFCGELTRIEQYLDILQPGSLYPEEDITALLTEIETEVSIIHEIIKHCH